MRDLLGHLSTKKRSHPQTPFLPHCEIFSTCGFQPCSHCTSLKKQQDRAACELTGCRLVFLDFHLQVSSNVPVNTMGINRPWFEHHSTAASSLLDMATLYRLQSGEKELHALLSKHCTLITVHSAWRVPEPLLRSSKYCNKHFL